jgi:HPt (histidine-containing phosphotransfer) domain-containing protein
VSDPVDEAFQQLRIEYLASLPARLDELRSDVASWRGGDPDALSSLQVRLHRLAGSGGSYRFVHLSSLARRAEHWLNANAGARETDELEMILDRLTEAAAEAQRRI